MNALLFTDDYVIIRENEENVNVPFGLLLGLHTNRVCKYPKSRFCKTEPWQIQIIILIMQQTNKYPIFNIWNVTSLTIMATIIDNNKIKFYEAMAVATVVYFSTLCANPKIFK